MNAPRRWGGGSFVEQGSSSGWKLWGGCARAPAAGPKQQQQGGRGSSTVALSAAHLEDVECLCMLGGGGVRMLPLVY